MRRRTQKVGGWPVRKTMCPTCPFKEGGDRELAARVMQRTLFKASQICHHPALHGEKERELCRGARNEQLTVLYRLGVLPAPTDEAYSAKLVALGITGTDSCEA